MLQVAKILHQSIMAGCYVGIGGLLSTVVAGSVPGIAASNPGLQKFIFAALFPMNLLLILNTGGQLFTGNSAAVPAALYEGLVSLEDVAKSWLVSYAGNVLGCGLMALFASYAGLLGGTVKELAIATAEKKCHSAFGPTLVKAIVCNWLVCMAVWLAGAANDMAGKMVRRAVSKRRHHAPREASVVMATEQSDDVHSILVWTGWHLVPDLNFCDDRPRALGCQHVPHPHRLAQWGKALGLRDDHQELHPRDPRQRHCGCAGRGRELLIPVWQAGRVGAYQFGKLGE